MDLDQRQVYYRSSARLGQVDWDVERYRYNQFVKMLTAKGGWEIEPLDKVHYFSSTPVRWTRLLLDKGAAGVERLADEVVASVTTGMGSGSGSADGGGGGDVVGAAQRALDDLSTAVQPLLSPIQAEVERLAGVLGEDNRVGEVIRGVVGVTEEVQRVVGEVEKGIEDVWEQVTHEDTSSDSGSGSRGEGSGGVGGVGSVMGDDVRPLIGVSKVADDDALLQAYSSSTAGDNQETASGSGSSRMSGSSESSDSAGGSGDLNMPAASGMDGVESWRITSNGDSRSSAVTSGGTSEVDMGKKNADRFDSRTTSQPSSALSRDMGVDGDDDEVAEVNDVEWLMDSIDDLSEPAPAARPRGSLGMTDAGSRSNVDARASTRVGAGGRSRRQEPLVFDELDRKVMKGQLDELRTKFGLYGSGSSTDGDTEVKQRLIDKFKR